mgnify:CR=1 FL=1
MNRPEFERLPAVAEATAVPYYLAPPYQPADAETEDSKLPPYRS